MEPIVIASTSEVRIGDTVRRTVSGKGWTDTRVLYDVAKIHDTEVEGSRYAVLSFDKAGLSSVVYEVIERRGPLWEDAKPDSLWRDDETDTLWRPMVAGISNNDVYFAQVGGVPNTRRWLDPVGYSDDRRIADRLVPVEPEGVSPWLWDPETGTAWVSGADFRTGVTHVQVKGQRTRYGYLSTDRPADREITARLIPYAEREQ